MDKKLLKEKLEENGCDNAKELKDYLIEMFESSLDMSYDDKNTKAFFKRLIENENSSVMAAYNMDIDSLNVFVYKDGDHISYYIPDEFKNIINKYYKW